jgi:hypothetical protein
MTDNSKEEMYLAIELWRESGPSLMKFYSLKKGVKNMLSKKHKSLLFKPPVLPVKTTRGFGWDHTWF